MRKFMLGVAALALAATGAHAQPGNGKGNGNGNGNGAKAAAGPQGGGNGSPGHGNAGNGKGKPGKAVRAAQNGPGNSNAKGNGNAKVQRAAVNRGNGNMSADNRANGNGARSHGPDRRYDNDRHLRTRVDRDRYDDGRARFGYWDDRIRDKGLIDGCPPGLAKKRNGCTPPGQLKSRSDRYYDRASWWGLPGLLDGRYRYYDGNLVRMSGAGSILGYYPLLGGALSVGNTWPDWYDDQPLPGYYESYYNLGSPGSYRYADSAIYRIDPETAAITSIAALLTGDDFNVGSPMPSGYSVYNVPYGYRDRYVDGPNAMYRYSDGYIYEVDPETRLIASAIELLI